MSNPEYNRKAQLSGNHSALIWKKELIGPILPVGWGGTSAIGHGMLIGGRCDNQHRLMKPKFRLLPIRRCLPKKGRMPSVVAMWLIVGAIMGTVLTIGIFTILT